MQDILSAVVEGLIVVAQCFQFFQSPEAAL